MKESICLAKYAQVPITDGLSFELTYDKKEFSDVTDANVNLTYYPNAIPESMQSAAYHHPQIPSLYKSLSVSKAYGVTMRNSKKAPNEVTLLFIYERS